MNRYTWLGGILVTLLVLIAVGYRNTPEESKDDGSVALTPTLSQREREPVVPPKIAEVKEPTKEERFAQLLELSRTGPLTPDLPEGLRRTGGKKAIEPILSVMRSTTDWKVVGACAVSLQNYHDPKLLHDVLMRLDELGLLDKSAKLPWISKPLFARYMQESPDVNLGLRAVQARPSLGEAVAQAK